MKLPLHLCQDFFFFFLNKKLILLFNKNTLIKIDSKGIHNVTKNNLKKNLFLIIIIRKVSVTLYSKVSLVNVS